MNKIFVLTIALLLIPLARTAFAAPAADVAPAQLTPIRFQGTMQSMENYSHVSPTLFVTATGSGDATQIGRFAVSYKSEWNLVELSATETAYFVTPDGNSFQARAVGQAMEDRTPGMYNLIAIYKITGGMGRFEGASGTFTLKRLVSLTTGATSSTFEGTILIP